MGAHSQQLQLLKGQQPLLWSLAHLLSQKSPLAGAEVVRQMPVRAFVGPLGPDGAHPSWSPRKAQGDGSGRALAHDAFYDPAERRDRELGWRAGDTHICSSRNGICQSSSFRTPRH